VSVQPPPARPTRAIALRDVLIEEKPGRLTAVFILSTRPDRLWIEFFRARAWYSIYDAAAARFSGRRARIELLQRADLPQLTASMERFIEGANFDAELSGLP
jgi:hypothetical protein